MNWIVISARLTAAGHEMVIFQVLDPNELAFDFNRAMLFQDVESQKDIYLDPETVRAEYQRKLQATASASKASAVNSVSRFIAS